MSDVPSAKRRRRAKPEGEKKTRPRRRKAKEPVAAPAPSSPLRPSVVVTPGPEYTSPAMRGIPALPPTGTIGLSHRDLRRGHAMVRSNQYIVGQIMLEMERASVPSAEFLYNVPFWDGEQWQHFRLPNAALFQGFCTSQERDLLVGCIRHVMLENAKATAYQNRVATAMRPGGAVSVKWQTPIVPVAPSMGGLFRTLKRYTIHAVQSMEESTAATRKPSTKPGAGAAAKK